MSHQPIRTPEWPRLRHSGFLTIDDQPDRITVTNIIGGWSRFMMGLQAISAVLATLCILSLIVDQNPVTYFLVCLFIGMTLRGIMMYWPLYLSTPHRVVFTANRIEFYGLFGNEFGSLPREAMQQIAVGQKQAGKKTICFHHFMADTGWVKAMPTFSQDDVLVRNNILMAAFGQPLHLSAISTSSAGSATATPAPNVAGLDIVHSNKAS